MEAIYEETGSFLSNYFITLSNGFSLSNVKTANRKRITLAVDTLNKFNLIKKNELKSSSYDRLEVTCENQMFPHIGYLQN